MSLKYKKCAYFKCEKNRENYGGHFFRFPDSSDLQKTWIANSVNGELIRRNIKNKLICDLHFHNSDFVNINRQKLIKNVNPIPCNYETSDNTILKVKESLKNYSHEPSSNDGKQFQFQHIDDDYEDDDVFKNEEINIQSSDQATVEKKRKFGKSSSGDAVLLRRKTKSLYLS